MNFQRNLLRVLRTETAAREAAIHAANGLIAEAQVITDLLKASGIECNTLGYSATEANGQGVVRVWCQANLTDIKRLAQALRENELVAVAVEPLDSGYGTAIQFVGLTAPLHTRCTNTEQVRSALVTHSIARIRGGTLSIEEARQAALAANMYLVSDGFDTCVSPIIPPGWREVPLTLPDTSGPAAQELAA